MLYLGTSGYSYKEWKGEGLFYPPELPDRRFLEHYAGRFSAVEINNTFYRMPSARILEGWRERVPESFVFVIKASRRITHIGRLGNVADSVSYLYEKSAALGDKLGPLLFQLPPYLRKDFDRLERFLDGRPDDRRIAIEFRHASWLDDDVASLLRAHDVALCHADGELAGSQPIATASWGYLRLRGAEYDDAALAAWIARIRALAWSDCFVFFKHEEAAAAPRLAARMGELA